jgi:hypothetical protein
VITYVTHQLTTFNTTQELVKFELARPVITYVTHQLTTFNTTHKSSSNLNLLAQ